MPKKVDHEQRRRQIAEAVWRIASGRGLEEVTLRQVAAEAGVSTRLVQYYFGSRDALLLGALELLSLDQKQRVEERIPQDASPRVLLREILIGLLPLDEHQRMTLLVQLAYFIRALNDEALAAAFLDPEDESLENLLVEIMTAARAQGQIADGLDLAREADTLLAVSTGVGPDILVGLKTGDQVIAMIDYHLDRIFVSSE
ncbi:TetR/AcrR family transcriptional regulator [Amycolatopsis sp. cg5]|uniref:TetR/AcrR family transcriptional regulator n=1 Tax=Amycolatopsis sp. cg5 TaxID=3238802 RepID=UPI003524AD8C